MKKTKSIIGKIKLVPFIEKREIEVNAINAPEGATNTEIYIRLPFGIGEWLDCSAPKWLHHLLFNWRDTDFYYLRGEKKSFPKDGVLCIYK